VIAFTPQERRILIFLVTALLLGSAVSLYRHRRSGRLPPITISSSDPAANTAADPQTPDRGGKRPDSPKKIDINSASREELRSLPGIGPHLAEKIVAHRDLHGPFSAPEEITAVRGIGPKTYDRFRDLIVAGSPPRPQKK
jgi:competence ComEA-like helix-hairpin-helix protein